MSKIHPNPIVGQVKVLLLLLLISALYVFLQGFSKLFSDPLILIAWGIGILSIIYLSIAARFISLDIGENDLLFKRGILSIRTSLVPFAKVTDARYSQTIAERIFSVGTLEVDTAGSNNVAIYIPSVPFRDLERVIETVRAKRGDEKNEE